MPLVLVEVPDEAAVEALRQQPNVHIVGIITQPAPAATPPPRKWAGALAGADAAKLRAHVEQVRGEWERDTQ